MRPDNGPAMNTIAMRDFDNPRDNRYGEADVVQVSMLYETRVLLEAYHMTFLRTIVPGGL